jgi:branched-chain amino acid transport system substrate-binding protein
MSWQRAWSSRRRLAAAAAASALALTLAACAGSASGGGGKEIRIGLIFPSTGSMAPLGSQQLDAAKMVLNWANAHGGIGGAKIKIFQGDSQSDPGTGATVAQQLIDQDQVQIIIGSYASGIAQAIAPVAERNKVVLWELGAVSPTVAPAGDQDFFRTIGASQTYARADLGFLKSYLAPKLGKPVSKVRVAVAHEDGPFGTSVAQAVTAQAKAMGVPIVTDIAYSDTAPDLTPVVVRLKAARPDVLLVTPLVASTPVIWQAAQAQNLSVKAVIGSAGFSSSSFLQKFGKKGVQGVYDVEAPAVANMKISGLQPQVRKDTSALLAQWQSKTGQPCLVHCGDALGGSYDLVKYVLPGAVRSGSVTADSIRAAALKVNEPTGGTPQGFGLHFSPGNGDNTQAKSVIMQWQDGNLKVVYPNDLAAAAPVFPMPTWSQR